MSLLQLCYLSSVMACFMYNWCYDEKYNRDLQANERKKLYQEFFFKHFYGKHDILTLFFLLRNKK